MNIQKYTINTPLPNYTPRTHKDVVYIYHAERSIAHFDSYVLHNEKDFCIIAVVWANNRSFFNKPNTSWFYFTKVRSRIKRLLFSQLSQEQKKLAVKSWDNLPNKNYLLITPPCAWNYMKVLLAS